jgi:hypothetical protein
LRERLEPWQWNWFREPMHRAKLVDENGVPLRVAGSGTSTSEKTSDCSVTYSASDATLTPATGKPAKLVWELPTARRATRRAVRADRRGVADRRGQGGLNVPTGITDGWHGQVLLPRG